MARVVLILVLFALCLLVALPKETTAAIAKTYIPTTEYFYDMTHSNWGELIGSVTTYTCVTASSARAYLYFTAQGDYSIATTSTSASTQVGVSFLGRKRSVTDGDDFMDRMLNSTIEDMVQLWDANCNGYVDVIEWVETAKGSPEDFAAILNKFDSNGDSRITYEEVSTMNAVINPNLERFMFMPMEEYEDMKEMADKARGESSQESPKERKTDE